MHGSNGHSRAQGLAYLSGSMPRLSRYGLNLVRLCWMLMAAKLASCSRGAPGVQQARAWD